MSFYVISNARNELSIDAYHLKDPYENQELNFEFGI